jgi:RHS repeat-associated protein
VSSSAKRRHRSRLSLRRSAARQSSTDVAGFRGPTWHRPSSGRPFTSEVHENARGVCVARWYDPGTGEFVSVDPDVVETGQPYAYAGDDPVNEADPTGQSPLGDQCPQETTGYTSQQHVKYNCIGIEPTQFGTNIWIRKGSSASFGLGHVQTPKHDLSLLALEWLLWYRVMPANPADNVGNNAGSERYDAYFQYPGSPTYTLGVEVRAQLGSRYATWQSPDGYPIGVTTAYCFRPGAPGAITCPKNINFLIISAPTNPNPPILNTSEVSSLSTPDEAAICGAEEISTGSWYTGPVTAPLTSGQID